MYSAVKRVGSAPAPTRARGKTRRAIAPKKVRIDRIELISYQAPLVELRVECSLGTYVRTLADDLGSGSWAAALICGTSAGFAAGRSRSTRR